MAMQSDKSLYLHRVSVPDSDEFEKPVGQGTCEEQTRLCGMDETAVRVRVLMAMEGIK